MLEKQRKWIKQKTERGVKFAKDHKLEIGIVIGGFSAILGMALYDKINEDKEGGVRFNVLKDKDGVCYEDKFVLETFGINRFGHDKPGVKVVLYEADTEWLTNDPTKVMNTAKEINLANNFNK